MGVFCIIALCVSGVGAVLSLLAVPVWLLGVPGVENSYAKCWSVGLAAVLGYPILWIGAFIVWREMHKQAGVDELSVLDTLVGTGSLALLALAAGMVYCAIRDM